jgi:hypothetical protein
MQGERGIPPLLKPKKKSAVGSCAGADCAILLETGWSYLINTGTLVVTVCVP